MARLNLEDRFFTEPRLRLFAKLLGVNHHEAKGILADIFHNSQSVYARFATAENIILWSEIDRPTIKKRLISAMTHESVQYLRVMPDGLYEIAGNGAQIDRLLQYAEKAAKGSEAAARKRKEIKERDVRYFGSPQQGTPQGSQQGTDKEPQGSSLQSNSMQLTSTHAAPSGALEDVEIQFENLKPEEKTLWEFTQGKFGMVNYRGLSKRAKSMYLQYIRSTTSDNVYNEIKYLTHFSQVQTPQRSTDLVTQIIRYQHISKLYSSVRNAEKVRDPIAALSQLNLHHAFPGASEQLVSWFSTYSAAAGLSTCLDRLVDDVRAKEEPNLDALLEKHSTEEICECLSEVMAQPDVSRPFAYLAKSAMTPTLAKISDRAFRALKSAASTEYEAEKKIVGDTLGNLGHDAIGEFNSLFDDEKERVGTEAFSVLNGILTDPKRHDYDRTCIVAGYWAAKNKIKTKEKAAVG